MFDNLTDAERQNNERTEPTFLKARKSKFFHQQAQSESEDSNGSHANVVGEIRTKEEKRISAANSNSNPNSFFNSLWVVPITILVFVASIFLTNSCLGL